MNVIEYLRPLYELRKLAEVYNDELAAHMLVNEVGVLNEKMVEYLFSISDITRGLLDFEIPSDHDTYVERVK